MPSPQVEVTATQVMLAWSQLPFAQSLEAVQDWPSAHLGHIVWPPQSTPLSPPFLAPSLHVATAQTPPAQTPLKQSRATAQCLPSAQGLQMCAMLVPPQSTSVSVEFWIPSLQVGATVAHLMAARSHEPLAQSLAAEQLWPSGHLGHIVWPPQSTPLSRPLKTPSLHVGAAQTPPVHTPSRQSRATRQRLPSAQGLQMCAMLVPPQSTSVSVEFWIPSLQVPCAIVSSWKSTPTRARPFRCMTSETSAIMPAATCTVTGSLTQLAVLGSPAMAQAPVKAAPENVTEPVGTPGIIRTALAPGMTSNCCVTVRAAVAVRLMQPTSVGTIVTATRTTPTGSLVGWDMQPS
jgi:hypothetical protein